MRRGVTIIEGLIVLVLLGVVMGSILSFLYHSQAWTARGTDHAAALTELRTGLERMVREIREGRQLVYPAVAAPSQPGLGLINARNESVFWKLEPTPGAPPTAGAPFDLVRTTLGDGGTREVVLRQVSNLLVSAADPGPGRDPIVARILVTRVIGAKGADSGVSLVTSVCLRSPRPGCLAVRNP